MSPDGRRVAFVGYEDRTRTYQVSRLQVMNLDGSGGRVLTGGLDRSVANPVWASDGSGLYFQYDDEGNSKVGFVTLDGEIDVLAEDLGGTSYGRPYGGGSFSVAGTAASRSTRPARTCPARSPCAFAATTDRGASPRSTTICSQTARWERWRRSGGNRRSTAVPSRAGSSSRRTSTRRGAIR